MLLTHSPENLTHWVLRMLKAEPGFPQWLPRPDPRKRCSQPNGWRSVREAQLLSVLPVTKTFTKAALKTSPGFLYQACLEEGIFQSLLIITTSLVVRWLKLRAPNVGVLGMGALVQPLVGELRFLHASGCDQNK